MAAENILPATQMVPLRDEQISEFSTVGIKEQGIKMLAQFINPWVVCITILVFVLIINQYVSARSFPSGNSTNEYKLNYIYLIGTASGEGLYRLQHLPAPNVDVLVSCYKAECASYKNISMYRLYYPNSTWTTARNRMLKEMELLEHRLLKRYDYVIFMDGDFHPKIDVGPTSASKSIEKIDTFVYNCNPTANPLRKSFTYIECMLKEYMPPIMTPRTVPWSAQSQVEVISTTYMDAACNAFHRDAADFLLPYCTQYDNQSWWASQAVLMLRMLCVYSFGLQFSWITWDQEKSGNVHGAYPRGDPIALSVQIMPKVVPQYIIDQKLPAFARTVISPIIAKRVNWFDAMPVECRNKDMLNVEHLGYD